jgi:uncharacterized membrane protein
MSTAARHGRWIAVLALSAGYALLAHYANTTAGTGTLGALLALAPIVLAALSVARHSRHRIAMLVLFGIGCAALLTAWNMLEQHADRIFWAEHAGSQLFLCLVFGRTLGAGQQPMCTYFARVVHGTLSPAHERYTRQVTVAWVAFFGLMAATSTILYFTAPLATWSMFANFFTAPLIGLMFIVEYAARRRLLPNMKHAHILAAVKAMWKAPAG